MGELIDLPLWTDPATETLACVRKWHDAWGSTEDDDVPAQRRWEQLDQILGGVL